MKAATMATRFGNERERAGKANDGDRDVNQKHRSPPEMLEEQSTDDRTEGDTGAAGCRPEADRAQKILPEVLAGDRASIGERLARVVLTLLEDPLARRRLTGLVRASSSEPKAAHMLREFLMREVIGPVAKALGSDEPELRVSLVGSQIIGLMMARYIVELEPLASLPAERVVEMVGPTLQRYLVRPLTQKD
jgi:hypothetical protein